VADPSAIAEQIAADVLTERRWLASRRAELEPERPRLTPRRMSRLSTSDEVHDALLALPADVWLPALTDFDLPRSRTIRCPFHGDGRERTPSCRIYETSFYCFGCGRGGDVFNFAGALWEIPSRSSSFPELRDRLARHILGAVA
jgi:hypothetical protein